MFQDGRLETEFSLSLISVDCQPSSCTPARTWRVRSNQQLVSHYLKREPAGTEEVDLNEELVLPLSRVYQLPSQSIASARTRGVDLQVHVSAIFMAIHYPGSMSAVGVRRAF